MGPPRPRSALLENALTTAAATRTRKCLSVDSGTFSSGSWSRSLVSERAFSLTAAEAAAQTKEARGQRGQGGAAGLLGPAAWQRQAGRVGQKEEKEESVAM